LTARALLSPKSTPNTSPTFTRKGGESEKLANRAPLSPRFSARFGRKDHKMKKPFKPAPSDSLSPRRRLSNSIRRLTKSIIGSGRSTPASIPGSPIIPPKHKSESTKFGIREGNISRNFTDDFKDLSEKCSEKFPDKEEIQTILMRNNGTLGIALLSKVPLQLDTSQEEKSILDIVCQGEHFKALEIIAEYVNNLKDASLFTLLQTKASGSTHSPFYHVVFSGECPLPVFEIIKKDLTEPQQLKSAIEECNDSASDLKSTFDTTLAKKRCFPGGIQLCLLLMPSFFSSGGFYHDLNNKEKGKLAGLCSKSDLINCIIPSLKRSSDTVRKEFFNIAYPLVCQFSTEAEHVKLILDLIKVDSTINVLNHRCETIICDAVRYGRLDVIKKFLMPKLPVLEIVNGKGENLLHIAAKSKSVTNEQVLEFLLENTGLKTNAPDNYGNTPLSIIVRDWNVQLYRCIQKHLNEELRTELTKELKSHLGLDARHKGDVGTSFWEQCWDFVIKSCEFAIGEELLSLKKTKFTPKQLSIFTIDTFKSMEMDKECFNKFNHHILDKLFKKFDVKLNTRFPNGKTLFHMLVSAASASAVARFLELYYTEKPSYPTFNFSAGSSDQVNVVGVLAEDTEGYTAFQTLFMNEEFSTDSESSATTLLNITAIWNFEWSTSTALHLAAQYNMDGKGVRFLLDNSKNSDRKSAAQLAIEHNNIESIFVLSSFDRQVFPLAFEIGTQELLDAICRKYTEMHPNDPLHIAAKDLEVDIMKYLIKTGLYDVNATVSENMTPIMLACQSQPSTKPSGEVNKMRYHIVKLLIKAKADLTIQSSNKRTVSHYAAESGDVDIINILHRKGVSLNEQDRKGNTPMQLAARNGYTKVVTCLERHINPSGSAVYDDSLLIGPMYTEQPLEEMDSTDDDDSSHSNS